MSSRLSNLSELFGLEGAFDMDYSKLTLKTYDPDMARKTLDTERMALNSFLDEALMNIS